MSRATSRTHSTGWSTRKGDSSPISMGKSYYPAASGNGSLGAWPMASHDAMAGYYVDHLGGDYDTHATISTVAHLTQGALGYQPQCSRKRE